MRSSLRGREGRKRLPSRPASGGGPKAPDPVKTPAPAEFRQELPRYDWIAGWFHGGPGLRGGTGRKAGRGPGLGVVPLHAFRYDPASGVPLSRYFFDATRAVLLAAGPLGRDGSFSRPVLPPFDECRLLFPSAAPALGLNPRARDEPNVRPWADRVRRERFAVVHPGGGSSKKRWPIERFRRVVGALWERGLGGILVSGETESDLEEALGRLSLPPGWRRLVRPPLSELARLLRAAAVYVGNDSGPTHLAAACGTETIAVFR